MGLSIHNTLEKSFSISKFLYYINKKRQMTDYSLKSFRDTVLYIEYDWWNAFENKNRIQILIVWIFFAIEAESNALFLLTFKRLTRFKIIQNITIFSWRRMLEVEDNFNFRPPLMYIVATHMFQHVRRVYFSFGSSAMSVQQTTYRIRQQQIVCHIATSL